MDQNPLPFPESALAGVGIVLLACTILYLIPRTAVLGAILLIGYLGGAVATQVRAGSGLFESFFPVILGALVWGGLFLRDARVREHIPMTGALLDRLTHRVDILEANGQSYRLTDAKRRLKRK